MTKDFDREELQALKDGFVALTKQTPRVETEIAFNERSTRRVGSLIATAATEQRADAKEPDPNGDGAPPGTSRNDDG